MSLNPCTLESGDTVVFAETVAKTVSHVVWITNEVVFSDRTTMHFKDYLWVIAERIGNDPRNS
jgi:hypothetical protein